MKVQSRKPKPQFYGVVIVVLAAVIAALAASLLVLPAIQSPPKPQLKIIEISYAKCNDCFNPTSLIEEIKSLNATIQEKKTVDFESAEAKELVSKYEIKKIPTLVVFGETTKTLELKEFWNLMGNVKEDNAVVITRIPPVYADASSGEVRGRVVATHVIEPNCGKCRNYTYFTKQLEKAGVRIYEEKYVKRNSDEGLFLVKAYNITKVPSLVLSHDINEYAATAAYLATVGSFESDGSFVLRENEPPYQDLVLDEVVGIVHLVNIVDSSCSECYNVSLVKEFIEKNFGLVFGEETTYDLNSSEGSSLVLTYNITKIPTSLLSWVAQLYTNLRKNWHKFGTIETYGYEAWLVFRNIDALGENLSYKELFLNQSANQSGVR